MPVIWIRRPPEIHKVTNEEYFELQLDLELAIRSKTVLKFNLNPHSQHQFTLEIEVFRVKQDI